MANSNRYHFVYGDICDADAVRTAITDFRLDVITHLAAGENGRRLGYNVEELLHMREVLGASPRRAAGDVPASIAV